MYYWSALSIGRIQPAYSPVLFMNVDGQPMSFFLRPGPTKRKLQPLITAGGGILSNVQQPGVILLMDPEERSSIPESTSHWYVSIQYIHDCIEKNEQLDLEDYKLNPGVVQRSSPRLNRSKESSPRLSRGRLLYTPEEDAAILSHVSKHKTEVGGNRLWQQMEKQRVTSHSWQSMKSHYKVLAEKQSQVVNLETTEDNKATEEETEVICPKPAATEPAAVSEAVNAQFNAHLFIFDSESQEEDSQSIVGDRPAAASNPEPLVNKDTAFSLTQTQLEEDKQRIRELMNQTDQDLVSVTKALLKTSGDFTAALDLLLNPSSISGPFWNRCDDNLLLSTDPVVRQQLQEKYGEEEVAKRIVFLEVV
uniref:Telomeric repeat-binding factor 2-interacting protein 1 n=1 Tax=Acanthochromis polyacanthus TaxID=80966 RepID=A0A3Q1GAM1_9TELE